MNILTLAFVPDWNGLSLNELDPNFDEEVRKLISDDDVPNAEHDNISKINIHEAANDGYIDVELGMPRGAK